MPSNENVLEEKEQYSFLDDDYELDKELFNEEQEHSQKEQEEKTTEQINDEELDQKIENEQKSKTQENQTQESIHQETAFNANENASERLGAEYIRSGAEQAQGDSEKTKKASPHSENIFNKLNEQNDLNAQNFANEKDIEEKEKEINAFKQNAKNNANFQDLGEDSNKRPKSLEQLEEELQALKDKETDIQERLKDNAENLGNSINELIMSKDIHQVLKALMKLLRSTSKARSLQKSFNQNKSRREAKEIELNEVRKTDKQIKEFVELFKEARNDPKKKEALLNLFRTANDSMNEVNKDYDKLKKAFEYYKDFNTLLEKRELLKKQGNDLTNNDKEFQKLWDKIEKKAPIFANAYPNAHKKFKEIIQNTNNKSQDKSKEQKMGNGFTMS